MSASPTTPARFLGLDLHKHYLLAVAVNPAGQPLGPPARVALAELDRWARTALTPQDALALEMTTNTWAVYDELAPRVHSVTVVHPPHVALIVRARVKTDRQAALALAQLHAAGLLVGLWVPPPEVRDLRALLAQRQKLVRLATQAKNRLHALLHRHHLQPPEGALFAPPQRDWWLLLSLSPVERVRLLCDLDTLDFAERQQARLWPVLTAVAAAEEQRVPVLLQLPGFGLINSLTVLAAIGDITRFPASRQLVSYAGLGAAVHASGLTLRTGRITKAGRRDLRAALVEAAQTAVNTHPHWQAELARLEPRLGRNKAIVAIARKLLVAVWHVLTRAEADRHADPERVARKLMQHAYRLGRQHRAPGESPGQYVRRHLDRLGLGAELRAVRWGTKKKPIPLPPPVPAA